MTEPVSHHPAGDPSTPYQAELPGIPRGGSLAEILSAYGLKPAEAPQGLRRFRHELLCGQLRATAEFWVTVDGRVDAFRIWSIRPRAPQSDTTPVSS